PKSRLQPRNEEGRPLGAALPPSPAPLPSVSSVRQGEHAAGASPRAEISRPVRPDTCRPSADLRRNATPCRHRPEPQRRRPPSAAPDSAPLPPSNSTLSVRSPAFLKTGYTCSRLRKADPK